MPGIQESKRDAKFMFTRYGVRPVDVPRFDGALHLFEHQYSEYFRFCHGAAEVASDDAYIQGVQCQNAMSFILYALLSDGRLETARMTQMVGPHWQPGSPLLIGLVGVREFRPGLV
jgi:hypothetical protein